MGTHAGVGMSSHRNPKIAGKETAQRAMEQAENKTPCLVLVFSTVGYDLRVLIESIRAVTGIAPVCGCSGEGVIGRNFADESSYSVGVMVLCSDVLRVNTGIETGLLQDPTKTGQKMGSQIASHLAPDSRVLLLFPDGLHCNFDRLIEGLYETAPQLSAMPLLGGFAGENLKLLKTHQFHNEEAVQNGVSWVLLSGSLDVAVAVNHGSIPIGDERTVTACAGNIIEEIDGLPALTVLKEYIDEKLMADWGKAMAPLALGFPAPTHLEDNSQLILRFIPSKDDATGCATFIGSRPVQLRPQTPWRVHIRVWSQSLFCNLIAAVAEKW